MQESGSPLEARSLQFLAFCLPLVTTDLVTFKMGKDLQKQDWMEVRKT